MSPLPFLKALSPLRKLLLGVILLIAMIGVFLFVRDLLTGTARTEAKLATGQADAAIQSGQDAAATVGQQAEIEAERERSVAEMQKDVNDAQDVSGAHDAGADWLCVNFGVCS